MVLSVAFFVWLVITILLLGFWFWSIYVVVRQKSAWKLYADKRKLRFHSRGFLETPSLSGVIDQYAVSMFASEHGELDGRSHKHLTAIEITLHTSLMTNCALASGGMVPVVEAIDFHQEFKPSMKGWDDSYIVRAQDLNIVREYLDADRLNKLIQLMKIDRAWIIFLFIGGKGILRLDTPLPIDNPKEIDLLIKQLINAAKALELSDGEGQALLRNKERIEKAKGPVLDIDEDLLDDHLGFELEDDE